MQVLVVDDSEMMRGLIVKELLSLGLSADEIKEARNGETAIELLNSQTFELLILDIVMEGIDGVAVLKEARRVQPEAKVVMCSTFSESGTVRELIDLGISDFIVKPFAADKLQDSIRRQMGKNRLKPQTAAMNEVTV